MFFVPRVFFFLLKPAEPGEMGEFFLGLENFLL